MENMRSAMDEMKVIIQIQAQIDSGLVGDGEEGLLSARLETRARGELDPRLVKQTITLLRMRQRVLQVKSNTTDSSIGSDHEYGVRCCCVCIKQCCCMGAQTLRSLPRNYCCRHFFCHMYRLEARVHHIGVA